MRITRLYSENVKRLQAVEIKPDGRGGLVIVAGKNGAGKSSVLDSILMGLAGGKAIPAMPVHNGKKKALIEIDLDCGLSVRRTLSSGGNTQLEVYQKNADGQAKISSPQTMLDQLVGAIGFDPNAFVRAGAKRQAEMLREISGLDFKAIDEKYESLYDERRDIGRDLKTAEGAAKSIADPGAEYAEEKRVVEIADRIAAAQKLADENVRLHFAVQAAHDAHIAALKEVGRLEQQLFAANQIAETCSADHTAAVTRYESSPITPDMSALQQEMADVSEWNKKVAQHQSAILARKQFEEVEAKHANLDRQIKEVAEEKLEMIESADLPVKGLGFSEDGVTFQGLPFDQCSQSEQMRIAAAVGFAKNPEMRVLVIRDGSLLDLDSLKMLEEMSVAHEFQVWIERVETDGPVSVIIEDGQVAKTS